MPKRRFPTGLPARSEPKKEAGSPSSAERLQKILAASGLGSRRKCEELIREGRVEIDGKTVTTLGTKVDPAVQKIVVDGELLPSSQREYYLVYKPTGVVTTNHDPAGRPRVVDLVPDGERLFAVGRLDLHSEGLILVTNDGALTNRLAHPRYGVEKTYHAIVAGLPEAETLEQLRKGVHLAEGFAHVKSIQIKAKSSQRSLLEIVLDEGRNREVRRLLARVDHKVLKLIRIAIGPLKLGEMKPGEYRKLTPTEVERLYRLTPAEPVEKNRPPRGRKKAYRPGAKPAPRREFGKEGRGVVRGAKRPGRAESRKPKPFVHPRRRELPEE